MRPCTHHSLRPRCAFLTALPLSPFSRRRATPALALACLSLTTASALAQCPDTWQFSVQNPGVTGVNSRVLALANLPNNTIIVGGVFTSAGGTPSINVAQFDPGSQTWLPLSASTNGPVNAFAQTLTGDTLVGGSFTTIGGLVGLTGFARYSFNTHSWASIGPGVDNQILAMASIPGGDVIIGGSFTTAGGNPGRINIVRFAPAPNVWVPLGPGVGGPPDSVRALLVLPNGDVIVGGSFSSAGGVAGRNNIARFTLSTSTWSAIGAGTSGPVNALALLPNGDVLVGGAFATADGIPASNIASLKPASNIWSAIGAGVGGPGDSVNAFAVTATTAGDVIVGGNFTSAGGVAGRNRLVRLIPSSATWVDITGPGTSGVVNTLLRGSLGADAYLGGQFAAANGLPASNIARVSLGNPAPSISAQPQRVVTYLGGAAAFNVSSPGATFQWRKVGSPPITLSDQPGRFYGTTSTTLVIANTISSDAGSYECLAISSCGTTPSNPAPLSFCTADFGRDGVLNVSDIFLFLSAWFAGCP